MPSNPIPQASFTQEERVASYKKGDKESDVHDTIVLEIFSRSHGQIERVKLYKMTYPPNPGFYATAYYNGAWYSGLEHRFKNPADEPKARHLAFQYLLDRAGNMEESIKTWGRDKPRELYVNI